MKRTQPLPFSYSYYQHLMLIVLILASGGRILGQEGYTLREALDAAELVWSTEQSSQWRPEKTALAKVGSGLVRFVSDDEGRLALLRSEIVGPGTLEFWWKVEVYDSDDEPFFSINDRTMLSRSEDSPAIWEQVRLSIPKGTHTLQFSATSGYLLLDGFDFIAGAALPVAEGFGDTDAIWMETGIPWHMRPAGGPQGQPAIVSTLNAADRQTMGLALPTSTLVRLSLAAPDGDNQSSAWTRLRYWTNQTGDGAFTTPAGLEATDSDWRRRSVTIEDKNNIVRFTHFLPEAATASTAMITAPEFQPIELASALDCRPEDIELAIDDPAGGFYIGEGQDAEGNGALTFIGGVARNAATITRQVTGGGLLTFSWRRWAEMGETITFLDNGTQRLGFTRQSSITFQPQAVVLQGDPETAHLLVWRMEFALNPYNPMSLDDILFSRSLGNAVISGAIEPGVSESDFFASRPDAVRAGSPDESFDDNGSVRLDAAALEDGDRVSLSMPVTGPALVGFHVKTNLPPAASLVVFASGDRIAQIDGDNGDAWEQIAVAALAGEQIVRWEIVGNGATLTSAHSVWLDAIEIERPQGSPEEALDIAFDTNVSSTSAYRFSKLAPATDGEDALALFRSPGGSQSSLKFDVDGPGILRFHSQSEMPVTLSLDNAPYQSWSAGTGHRDMLVPGGHHSVGLTMGQFESVLWLNQLSFTPAQPVSVSEALDNAELQFTTAGHRTWQGLGSLPSVGKGDDVLVLDNPVPTSGGTLSAEVSGPALISFNYKQSIGVSQGMFTGVAPTPVPVLPGFDPDWSTGYVLVPEGATQINWTGWGTAQLDDFQRAPEAEAARLLGALGTTDLAWSGTSNVPWEVTGSPEAVRVGLPADVTGRIDSRLRTEVTGPAVIDFQAIVDSNASDNENWNFEVSLQSVTDNFYRSWPLTATDGYWRNVSIPIPAGSHTFTVAAYTPYPGNGMTLRNFRLTPVDIPLATAIGAPGLDWHTGDNAPWIGQPESRGYSVISGQVPAGETSWLETTVRGPVDIAFARIAQANNVSCFTARFSIDGVGVETINSIGYWQTRTYSLDEARDYVLRWELTPTAEAPTGADPALVVSDFRFLGTYEQKVTALALPTAKSAPTDDADYDGLTNELELKLGTDPLQPDHNSVQLVPTPFGLEFSYPIPDSSALEPLPPNGDAIVVEISPDLMSWEQLPPFTRRFADPFGITGYRARVQLPQPATGDSVYVRLRAEEAEQENQAE